VHFRASQVQQMSRSVCECEYIFGTHTYARESLHNNKYILSVILCIDCEEDCVVCIWAPAVAFLTR